MDTNIPIQRLKTYKIKIEPLQDYINASPTLKMNLKIESFKTLDIKTYK